MKLPILRIGAALLVSGFVLPMYDYCLAQTLMGSPIFFQETHYYTDAARNQIRPRDGQAWRFRDTKVNPYQQEHQDLIASIRAGNPLNEAKAVAESTLMAIMGRESAYSGQSVEWDKAFNSITRLGPDKYEFGNLPFREVAIPGRYKFV